MATKSRLEPLIVVIVGPTASGKSRLAMDIAKRFNGEIICADSRTVYRGMDIGTAKPTQADRHAIPHWGLDLVQPNERFTAADFKEYATKKIVEIQKRGRLPILVGGTGLYVDSVLFDYQFGSKVNNKLRSKLQQLSLHELQDYCKNHQINLPENDKNIRYIIRSIENSGVELKRNKEPVYKNIIVGITTDKITLLHSIKSRIEQMLENGVVNEANKLGNKYGWGLESMKSNIYPLIHRYIKNQISLDDLKLQSSLVDWRLAKRQITWLKRNKFIHWDTLDQLNTYLSDHLATRT